MVFWDALGGGESDPPVDCQGLAQPCNTVAGLAVLEVTSTNAFQGMCFFKR